MKNLFVRNVFTWIIGILVTLLVGAQTLHAQAPEGDTATPIGIQDEAFELEVIRLTNLERTTRGLPPLLRNSSLTAAARAHNQDMITNEFFSHMGSDGSSPSERGCSLGYMPYGWGQCYVGENIAAGYDTPASVVQGWMNSPGHRANILNSLYREIGLGHSVGGSWGDYWTMDLASQPNVLPVFVNNDADETDSREVEITLTKEDVSSWGSIGAITGVQVSEDPSFSGATWQPWSKTIPFTLSPGDGVKTVYVRFTDGSKQVTSSDVIVLSEPPPTLVVSADRVLFLAKVGNAKTTPTSLALTIDNAGTGVLHWTANSSDSWLVLGSESGDAPATVSVSVNNSGGVLNSLGKRTGSIVVTATNPDAVNSPQTISVVLNVVEEIYPVYLPTIHK